MGRAGASLLGLAVVANALALASQIYAELAAWRRGRVR